MFQPNNQLSAQIASTLANAAATTALNQATGTNLGNLASGPLHTLISNQLGANPNINPQSFNPTPGLNFSPRQTLESGGAAFGAIVGAGAGSPAAMGVATQVLKDLGAPQPVVDLFQKFAPMVGQAGGAALGAAIGQKFGSAVADALKLP